MAESRKAVRRRAAELREVPTDELLSSLKGSLNETEHDAIVRVLRSRAVAIPEEQGTVTPDEVPTKIFQIEDLAGAGAFEKEKSRFGMGWPEGICLLAGVAVCSFLWMRIGRLAALASGVAVLLVLYGLWVMARKTFEAFREERRR